MINNGPALLVPGSTPVVKVFYHKQNQCPHVAYRSRLRPPSTPSGDAVIVLLTSVSIFRRPQTTPRRVFATAVTDSVTVMSSWIKLELRK